MNIELMSATLVEIQDNPIGWNQLHYRHMGTTCFAARACLIAGYTWKRSKAIVDPFMTDNDGHEIHCRTLAKQLLGLTQLEAVELFNATNTLDDLVKLVDWHTAKALV